MSSIEGAVAPVVLFQDAWIVAVAKPSGVPVQPDPTGDADLLGSVRGALGDPSIGLVHRIDRPVSGVVLFSRGLEAPALLHAMFRERRMEKCYWAIVEGKVAQEEPLALEHGLVHDPRSRRARVVPVPQGEAARMRVRVLAPGDRYTLVEVVPEGGAFHQIRAQLGAWGHPIKGDVKYGARRGERDRSIALHARSLRFQHPVTGTAIVLEAAPPSGGAWPVMLALSATARSPTSGPRP